MGQVQVGLTDVSSQNVPKTPCHGFILLGTLLIRQNVPKTPCHGFIPLSEVQQILLRICDQRSHLARRQGNNTVTRLFSQNITALGPSHGLAATRKQPIARSSINTHAAISKHVARSTAHVAA